MKYILTPNSIKLISISEKLELFFHSETMQIYPINNPDIITFLKYYKINGYNSTKKYLPDVFNDIYKFICKKIRKAPKSLVWDGLDTSEENFINVILPISAECNLQCPYCFAQTGSGFQFENYTELEIKNTIDFILNNLKDKKQKVTIVFFGGEPLIKFDLIKFTIDYIKINYPNNDINYSITTNGTILNEDIISILKSNNFSVLVSLDGYDNEFNLRIFKNGSKSINRVIGNINRLKENGVYVEIRATLVNNNPYLCETYQFFEKIALPFNVVYAYSSENKEHHYAEYDNNILCSIESQFDRLLKIYLDKLKAGEPIFNKTLKESSDLLRFRIKKIYPCSGGTNYFTITSHGNIFSCAHLMNDTKYQIGTIKNGMTCKSDFIAVNIENIQECSDCWLKYLCAGGCFSQKISSGKNNYNAQVEERCKLDSIIWEFYIKLYYYTMRIAPKYITQKNSDISLNSNIDSR